MSRNVQLHISQDEIEQYMRISQDIKKEFYYSKCEGTWHWYDRGNEEYEEQQSPPFKTFFDALSDAVEPYIGNESQEIGNE